MTMINELVSTEDLNFNVDFKSPEIIIKNEEKLTRIAEAYAHRYDGFIVTEETKKDVVAVRKELRGVV